MTQSLTAPTTTVTAAPLSIAHGAAAAGTGVLTRFEEWVSRTRRRPR